jgi:glycosyltransferase involved in cell wall biosynthesis
LADQEVITTGWRPAFETFRAAQEPTMRRRHERHVSAGRAFATSVERILGRQSLDPSSDGYFGYTSTSLELLGPLTQRGIRHLVCQIDAARIGQEITDAARKRWPDWQSSNDGQDYLVPDNYWDRIEAEWNAADAVVVNSRWSYDALVNQGVAPEKLNIVPLSYSGARTQRLPDPRTGTLNVMFLGRVTVDKGIGALAEAARLLSDANVRIIVVGAITMPRSNLPRVPDNMCFLGPVPRDQAATVYRQADLFVLPTLSDGFGLTQLEAMANGLPVIATRRCGDVVIHGQNGLLVEAESAQSLADAVRELEGDRDRLHTMALAAIKTVDRFSPATTLDSLDRIWTDLDTAKR